MNRTGHIKIQSTIGEHKARNRIKNAESWLWYIHWKKKKSLALDRVLLLATGSL